MLEKLKQIKISLQCWQGDDISGFLFKGQALSGGILGGPGQHLHPAGVGGHLAEEPVFDAAAPHMERA